MAANAKHPRFLGINPAFEPLDGTLIREPVGDGAGYWVGAPGVYLDRDGERVYLLYRIRRPRGVQPDRGAEVRLAISQDGLHFDDVWTIQKSQLDSSSIERCCLTQAPGGEYLLYISYVDGADNRWRTDVVASPSAEKFDVQQRRKVFTAGDIGAEGVKDPWVISLGGVYHMLLSYATREEDAGHEQLHSTADAYNTGLIRSRTGLATSLDGVQYTWQGDIFSPSESGWDCYAGRLNSLWYCDPIWIGFYDGSASVRENYEERCGLAIGADFRNLARASARGPWVTVPHGTGSVRYLDVLPQEDRLLMYYELVRPDGAHELRCFPLSL